MWGIWEGGSWLWWGGGGFGRRGLDGGGDALRERRRKHWRMGGRVGG